MFKVGDKVECIRMQSAGNYVMNTGYIGYVTHVKGLSLAVDGLLHAGHTVMSYQAFKLVEEKPQFDLKKNPWFIRTGTKEKSEAAQKWLFEHGMSWSGARGNVILNFGEDYLVNVSGNGYVGEYVMWCSDSSPHASAKEIIMEFETVVKSVTYPVLETESAKKAQDKKIKELKETIDKAQQQLEEMMGK